MFNLTDSEKICKLKLREDTTLAVLKLLKQMNRDRRKEEQAKKQTKNHLTRANDVARMDGQHLDFTTCYWRKTVLSLRMKRKTHT